MSAAYGGQILLAGATRTIVLPGSASAFRQDIGVPLSAMARADFEQMLAPARKLLGEEVTESIWSEGLGLKIEQIVAEAEKEYNQLGLE